MHLGTIRGRLRCREVGGGGAGGGGGGGGGQQNSKNGWVTNNWGGVC